MKALENAKAMRTEELKEKIASSGLREYGVFPEPLTEKWENLRVDNGGALSGVAAGLNNSDTDHLLLGLLREEPERIFDGMEIAALALGVQEKILFLPEDETDLAAELKEKAQARGIEIRNEFINVREYAAYAVHHIVAMLQLSEVLEGAYAPAVYLGIPQENAKEGAESGLRKIPYGTGIADLVKFDGAKAVVIGSRLYTPEAAAALAIDEKFAPGSGAVRILGEKTCIVQECEKNLMESRKNGCGKCTFCREGLNQICFHIQDITSGKGKKEALPMIREIGEAMSFSCACSVGTVGADFTLDALDGFESEFDAHIRRHKCPAGVCTCFMTIYIDPQACEGCEECADVCPQDCIEGKAGYIHMIDEFDCTKCGKCIEVCENDAVISTTGRVPKLPTRLTKCGKFKKRH